MNPEDHLLLDQYLAAIAAAEALPSEFDLADAPDLGNWRPVLTLQGVPLLWGRVARHPRLGDALITTSPLIAIDTASGWARTLSRWYRLGEPFDTVAGPIECDHGTGIRLAEIIAFDLHCLIPITDPDLLARLLAMRIDSIRGLAKGAHPH